MTPSKPHVITMDFHITLFVIECVLHTHTHTHIYIYVHIYKNKELTESLVERGGKTILKNKTARVLSSGTIHARLPESSKNG